MVSSSWDLVLNFQWILLNNLIKCNSLDPEDLLEKKNPEIMCSSCSLIVIGWLSQVSGNECVVGHGSERLPYCPDCFERLG